MSGSVLGVVLAAGAARRMGRPKQLLALDGRALVVRAVEALVPVVDGVLVVTGARADEVRSAVVQAGHRDVEFVANEAWRSGMGTSVAAGAVRAIERGADMLLVTTCDQPNVGREALSALRRALATSGGAAAAAAAYDDVLGVPAAFCLRTCGHALTALGGDRGARSVLRQGGFEVVAVAMPEATHDIDTADDLAAARAHRGAGDTGVGRPSTDLRETTP